MPARKKKGMTWDDLRAVARTLVGVEDGTSYGTPALKAKGKLLARLKEDGETVALDVGFAEREELIAKWPKAFYFTEHYASAPFVLMRLAEVSEPRVRALLFHIWHRLAPEANSKSRSKGR